MENFEKDLTSEKIPEYTFREGVEHCVAKITGLIDQNPYVVVGFSVSGQHVGKTTIAREIQGLLNKQGAYCFIFHTPDEIQRLPEGVEINKAVFILDELSAQSSSINFLDEEKAFHDKEVINACKKIGCKVKGVDIWVGIYRPDTPFATRMESGDPARPIADFLIRNDAATNKGKL
ncbi:MAG: hypothetical protein Q8R31_04645 [Candidatus Omnitrophota bacterium]|nr:hypothetical protein [Candidatus Omnitrophota bacterium]